MKNQEGLIRFWAKLSRAYDSSKEKALKELTVDLNCDLKISKTIIDEVYSAYTHKMAKDIYNNMLDSLSPEIKGKVYNQEMLPTENVHEIIGMLSKGSAC
jgi:hypothetical protein